MTVTAEAAPGVDRAAVDQQFTEIYAEHYDRLVRFVRFRVNANHTHLAEDFAQEAFITLWRKHLLKGKHIDRPYPFLSVIARHLVIEHYGKLPSRERALDFGDPVNTPIVASVAHAYALYSPELAELNAELEAAMERMGKASLAWRESNKASHSLRNTVAGKFSDHRGGMRPAKENEAKAKLVVADAVEAENLETFRRACQRVGQIRLDMEATAGPNWAATTPQPLRPPDSKAGSSYRTDLSMTHCPEGHVLDRVNTYFSANGSRRCRPCHSAMTTGARLPKMTDKRQSKKADLADIAKAVEMFTDPDNSMSIPAVARAVGVCVNTLRRHIPNITEIRRDAKSKQLALVSA